MSRSGFGSGAREPRQARRVGRFSLWHIGCIAFGQGCFYIEPTWQPAENHAPQILSPDPLDTTLFFRSSTETLQVVAFDEDGDNLLFFWALPPFTAFTEETWQEETVWSSRLQIDFDPALDGEQIELLIVDQVPRDAKSATFVWDVVVP
ncbi:MAG: hypothetical protein H6737_17170 [Alphaproteobacteria bacterium]|nr:hypothetical protein [Alphaproteobacteria bacterium]